MHKITLSGHDLRRVETAIKYLISQFEDEDEDRVDIYTELLDNIEKQIKED